MGGDEAILDVGVSLREGFGGLAGREDQEGAVGRVGEGAAHDELPALAGGFDEGEMGGTEPFSAFEVVGDEGVEEGVARGNRRHAAVST